MADFNIDRLHRALAAADKAGNVEDAKAIAAEIRRIQIKSQPSIMDNIGLKSPTEGMSGTELLLAGAGKAFYDVGRGAGTMLTDAIPAAAKLGLATRKDVDESRKRDAPLMATTEGTIGNVAGNVAINLPLAAIPGINTVRGGAMAGAAMGLMEPVGTHDSRMLNAGISAGAGGFIPAASKGYQIAKSAFVDPLTDAGRTKIAAGLIKRSAENPDALMAKLAAVRGNTPGFNPTVGQAGGDAGVASMERALRAVNPAGFNTVETQQRKALADSVRGVAGTAEERAAADAAREGAANTLYNRAFASDLQRQDMARMLPDATAWATAGGAVPASDLATPGLRKLAERPAFQTAIDNARQLAANDGIKLQDPMQSLRGLHYIKMALDDMGKPVVGSSFSSSEARAINGIKAELSKELESISPLYGNARSAFAEMSVPVNRMDIGQNLYNRLVPAIAEADAPLRLNAGAFTNALRNRDDLAKTVIGRDIPFNKIFSQDQTAALEGVSKDLQMRLFGETAGKGVGSDTVQKIAMSHLAEQAGVPTWLGWAAGKVPGGGVAKGLLGTVYGATDKPIQAKAAALMANPQDALFALRMLQNESGLLSPEVQRILQPMLLAAPPAIGAAQ